MRTSAPVLISVPILIQGASLITLGVILAFIATRAFTRASNSHAITIPLEADIQTLDPARLSDPSTSRIVWQIYEGLVALDADNHVSPALAESIEALENGKVWRFQIRQGVMFHPHPAFGESGTRELTAHDVEYSYLRMARGFGSFVFGGLVEGFDDYIAAGGDKATTVSGLHAESDRVFVITLTRPDPAFLNRISSPYLGIFPREVVEADPDAFGVSTAIGTGPFRLLSRSAGTVQLERNPDYHGETTGNVEHITFRVETNAELRASGLRSGTYDILEPSAESRAAFFDGDDLRQSLSNTLRAVDAQTFNVHYLGMNLDRVKDPRLRKAIALAIDRESIASGLLGGAARPAGGPVPPTMLGYVSTKQPPASVQQARAELAASEYDGHPLVLLTSSAQSHQDVAVVIKDNLEAVGIAVEISQVDEAALITRLFADKRDFDLWITYIEWIYSAPELVLEQFRAMARPNPNVTGFADPRVDQLLKRLTTGMSRETINAVCGEIERIVHEAPPAVWLYNTRRSIVLQGRLDGLRITGNNHWLLSALQVAP